MSKCQDSGAQVLRPTSDGTAWCGCCGRTVAVILKPVMPGDSNLITLYADHQMGA